MARPIKEIPVLRGKSSKFFNQSLNENAGSKVSVEERDRILAVVKAVVNKQKLVS